MLDWALLLHEGWADCRDAPAPIPLGDVATHNGEAGQNLVETAASVAIPTPVCCYMCLAQQAM